MDGQTTGTRDIPRNMLYALGMLLLAGVLLVALLQENFIGNDEGEVTMYGEGKVAYNPDMAIVTLGVQIDKAPSAQQALTSLNSSIQRIIPAIEALGIAKADIETQNYSLYPNYDYVDGITRPAGYNANQQLIVKIRNVEDADAMVSRVIAEASRTGANQVLGVSFETSNLEDLKQQALLAAIEDAKSRAEDTAKRAGIELDEIVGWVETPVFIPGKPYMDYGMGMGGGSGLPAIPVGGKEITVRVGLIYSLD